MRRYTTWSRWLVSLLLALSLLVMAACGGQQDGSTSSPSGGSTGGQQPAAESPAEPQRGGTLTVAIQSDITTLDPHNTGDIPSMMMQKHIYETLVKWSPEGELVPGLAERWEWSDDGLTLTVELVQGVRFHDGTTLDAGVVVANFERILNPDNNVRALTYYRNIERVEAIDANTVAFRLSRPSGELIAALASPMASIISKQALETLGEGLAREAVGSGPYRLVRWDSQQQIVLEAFEDYHGEGPYLDSIVFLPVPDEQSRVALLEAGDVDVAAPLPLQDLARLQSDPRFVVESIQSMDNLHMPLNELQEPLKDVRVRQALNYAVDKEAIVRSIYLGYATPLDSPITPTVWGYAHTGDHYPYDPDKARALLAEAGYPDGFDLTVWIPDGRYNQDRRVGEAVAGYLQQIGVNVDLQTYEFATYVQKLYESKPTESVPEYGAVMLTLAPSSRDAHRGLNTFRCDTWLPGGLNASYHCDEALDSIQDEAAATVDTQKRLELYREAQRMIMEGAPAIFLVAFDLVAAYDTSVHGVVLDPLGGLLLTGAWIEQ